MGLKAKKQNKKTKSWGVSQRINIRRSIEPKQGDERIYNIKASCEDFLEDFGAFCGADKPCVQALIRIAESFWIKPHQM